MSGVEGDPIGDLPTTAVVVGVDGGGSRTRIRAEAESGAVVAGGEAGPASGSGRTPAELGDWLAREVGRVVGERPVVAVHLGLAGAGDPSVRAAVQAIVAERLRTPRVSVGTDLEIALHSAFGSDPGILLLAGTGSASLARDAAGGTHLVGGWGPAAGDEGSGFALGRAAIGAVLRAADGRGPATALTGLILAHTGTVDAHHLARWAASASRREMAAVTPAILEASGGEDAVAGELLDAAAEELVAHVRAASAAAMGGEGGHRTVVLSGGLLSSPNPLEARVRRGLSRHGFAHLEHPALGLEGAVALAREAAGWDG